MELPIIALTMGDPAGVGPEIVLQVLADSALSARYRPIILGDPGVMQRAAGVLENAPALRPIHAFDEAAFAPTAIDVLSADSPISSDVPFGRISQETARAMLAPLNLACELAMAGRIQGIVSAPLNKEAFSMLGHAHHDEVEYMSDLTGSSGAFILGVMRGIWVVSIAEHVPFREIIDLITRDNVLHFIGALDATMRRTGLAAPHIAVAALNVHGGEGGALGTEEITEITPAIEAARAQGIDVVGPIPADTVFGRALAGEFDGVVAMYHDQANIARKLQPMAERVTLFEGLPVPCGTTAHGVAYDIAGQGVADPGSLSAAVHYVIQLAKAKR